ncbi:calcium-binding protein, partial [Acinetobacter sp. YH1901134]|uniref:calcium-binding protein n=1 Tax=Acinetobacter sp. YH1901134 TaxID=2601199 RepID=UPI0015D11C4A
EDQVTVQSFFDSNGATAYRIDQILFADQTVWDVEYIKQQILVPTESNDTIQGYSSNDVLSGEAGADLIYGNNGSDQLYGGTGEDKLYGGTGDDYLEGGADNDQLYGGSGNDILVGSEGDDTLEGGAGNDTYIFAANFGHDIINNYDNTASRQDVIQFTDGQVQTDFTFRRINNDLVIRTLDGENSITVQNYFQSDALVTYRIDQIQFSDEMILDVEAVKALVLLGTEGTDILQAYASGSTISGEAGDDQIYGNTGSDQLYGGTGQDKLYGGTGDDYLEGGADNDQLYGGSGNDVLVGGMGDDTLDGGTGNDTYIFAANFGHDIINNYDNTASRQDVIQFTDGQVQTDFTFRRINNDLVIRTLDGENSITVQNYFQSDALGTYRIDQIQFSDEMILDVEAVKALVLLGTEGTDILQAYASGSTISGEAGDDQIYGNTGSDQLYGGTGEDKLYGGTGDDYLEGGADNDQLYGGSGNDVLVGGMGDDTLDGGTGNDTYIFAANFGHDIISNYDNSANRQDIIQFTDGQVQTDFTFRRINNDLVIRTLDGENSITVQNYFQSDALGAYRIDQIQFSDEMILDVEAVKALVLLGTEGTDILQAYASGSTISGEAGDDQIYGNTGSDQLYGGTGEDKLYGGTGDDYLEGGADNDQLYGGSGNDVLVGGTGDDRLEGQDGDDVLQGGEGDDTLAGGTGNDTLIGSEGNDTLEGGAGNDIYQFEAGWGQDIILYEYKNETDKDTIAFINIDPDNLIVRKVGQDMVITHRITGDQLIVQSQFSDSSNKPINLVQFDNNVEWNEADLDIQAVKGTELDDVIEGTTDSDVIHAGNGDDIIYGSSIYTDSPEAQYFVYGENGNDKIYASGYLDGGDGDDEIEGAGHLLGGAGNDVLNGHGILEGQAGNDILTGQGKLYGGDGTDQLILIGLDDNQAGLLDGGSGDDVLVVDINQMHFVDSSNESEFILDADGYHVILDPELTEAQRAVYIEGGQGNDTIYGSFGDEVYLFNLGDGQDTIIERPAGQNYSNVAVSFDVLRFGQNIATTDISLHRFGDDLLIQHGNNVDQITVQNYFVGGHHKINEIQFEDLTIWNNSYIENHVTYHGTADNDEVWGYRNTHETFEMGAGNDKVYAGSGNDIIYGQEGDDTLWGQTGNDTLYGGAGSDYLEGNEGNDVLHGDEGNDTLYGGAGDDSIYGGIGNDRLSGGAGTDILNGGEGDDEYLYYLTDGPDVIDQTGGGTDVLWLMDYGITPDRISFNKDGNDLIVIIDQNANQSVRIVDHFLGGEKAISSVNANNQIPISAKDIEGIIKAQAYGGLYDTVLEGTNNAETIYGTSGNDLIQGLDGNDTIWAQAGNDRVEGGAGNDYLDGGAGDDSIYGGIGNDTLIGGAGIDTLDGGAGDDKYYYYLADGADVIDQTGGGTDVIWLMDQGITDDRIKFTKENNDLLITIDNNSNQSIRVKDHFLGGEKAISSVQPNGGYTITAAQIATKVNNNGGEETPNVAGDTTYNYSTGALTITEQSGTDKIVFASGITLSQISSNLTKSGNDLIIKVNGSTTNIVTVKNFFLAGDYLVESFQTAAGEQITASQIFTAYGLTIPGTGSETPNPVGDTTYSYTSGALTITEQSGTDKVVFASGITFSHISSNLTMSGNDLIIKVNGSTANIVTVKNFFLAGNYLVETFQTAAGEQITANQIFTAFGLTMPGTGGGAANAEGDTTYNYTSGDLTITEVSGNDKVVFASGITFSQIGNYLTMSGNDLILKVNGSTTNKITVKNFFLAGNNLVETFQFATGEEITADDIFGAFGLTLPSTGGGTETGSSEVEGDTTYEYTTGALMINEVSGNDKVVFKNGITFSQIGNYLNMSGNDLILKLDGSNTNKVTVKDFFLGGDYVVETFAFETGGQITASQIFGAFGLTMPAATSLTSVESYSFDNESSMYSDDVYQNSGENSPLNAEYFVQSIIIGDAGDNLFISDPAVSELFIMNDGQDIIKLLQNASGVTAIDYVSDFKISEDQLDFSEFLDNSQVNSSNLNEFLNISYDETLKTNTISVNDRVNGNSQELLILTNQTEYLSVQDLLLNQSVVY